MEGTCPAGKLTIDGQRGPSCPHGYGKFCHVPGQSHFYSGALWDWGCEPRDQKSPGHDYAGVASLFGTGPWLEVLGRRELGEIHHWRGLLLKNEF